MCSLHTLHFFLYFFSRGSVSLCWGLLPSPRKNWTSVTTSSSWCRDRSSCCRRSSLRLTVSSLSSIMFQVRVCSLPATVQLFRNRDQMNSWFFKSLWEWLYFHGWNNVMNVYYDLLEVLAYGYTYVWEVYTGTYRIRENWITVNSIDFPILQTAYNAFIFLILIHDWHSVNVASHQLLIYKL